MKTDCKSDYSQSKRRKQKINMGNIVAANDFEIDLISSAKPSERMSCNVTELGGRHKLGEKQKLKDLKSGSKLIARDSKLNTWEADEVHELIEPTERRKSSPIEFHT